MTPTWFSTLTGFEERDYAETQANLEVVGGTLRSKVNGQSYAIGTLETPSVGELRARALANAGPRTGRLRVASVSGDVARLHHDSVHRHALFQVASQFNLLEMTGPDVRPEYGVTRYVHDRTQGPACAIAAGAATIYRNYLMPVDGLAGQTAHRQVDCLRDIGTALGNDSQALWTMQNGYALCSGDGLTVITRTLAAMSAVERDALRDRLRVGVHWGVQVTAGARADQLVSQAFCAALPVSYTSVPSHRWAPFATLVLEGAYEATLWAAVLNARQHGSNVVFLTHLGSGAFGNERAWIDGAMRRALHLVQGLDLDVRIVSYHAPSPDVVRLVADFA